MSTSITRERMASEPTSRSGFAIGMGGTSPRLMARIAGALYLLTILAGMFSAGFATGKLVVSGDAAATSSNILAHRGLFSWLSRSISSKWRARSRLRPFSTFC